MNDGVEHLRSAVRDRGLVVSPDDGVAGLTDRVRLTWEGGELVCDLVRAGQVTGARARELVGGSGVALVVADRITADARTRLSEAGWSYLDLRGQVHLRGGGLFVDGPVAVADRPVVRQRAAIRGKAGLAVAYWLCAHPGTVLSPTGVSAALGFAPSTISTATSAMVDAGLVDSGGRAVLPELFWELAQLWRPQWTWLAARPDPADVPDAERGTGWVRTGDAVAVASGAPLVSAGSAPLELFVPGAVAITMAVRRYGAAAPGAGLAAVAVAPVQQVLDAVTSVPRGDVPGAAVGRMEGWRTAPVLAVALGLAADPARGREIVEGWLGADHGWL